MFFYDTSTIINITQKARRLKVIINVNIYLKSYCKT